MPDHKMLLGPNSPISSNGGENMIEDDPELDTVNNAHLNNNDKMSCDQNNNNNDDKRLIIDENLNNRIFAKNDGDKNEDCDSVTNKNNRLYDHTLDKSQKMNLLLAHHQQNFDYDERDIEQDLMQVRRLTLEKAQSDLLAGFGLSFPLLGGLHYLPNGHSFLPAAGLNPKTMAPADLMNLSTLIQHQNLLTSPPPVIGHKTHSFENLRRKSSPINGGSPEPEDLSMNRNSNVLDRQKRLLPAMPNDAATTVVTATVRRTPSSMIAVDDYADLHSLSPADSSINAASGSSHNQQNWSFEEQFKQLYDLGSDQKRKEFLDDLFSFMQKRGTPVTRIPIMAKQVLDLYELYKLVVSHGGLVEVINKKMWREITKGLNLPSSITSAAFTLRTQYMKYLYPYECEKEKLSSPAELQSAIDGNRREGRRTGYHPYSQISPTLLPAVSRHHLEDDGIVPPTALTQQAIAAAYREQALAIEAAQRHFELSQRENQRRAASDGASSCSNESLINEDTPMTPLDATTSPQRPSLYPGGVSKPSIKNQPIPNHSIGHPINGHVGESPTTKTTTINGHLASSLPDSFQKSTANGLETNNQKAELNERSTQEASSTLLPTTHIKVTSRNDGQSKVDTSLVVSMEINGVMYQGVLFAQPNA